MCETQFSDFQLDNLNGGGAATASYCLVWIPKVHLCRFVHALSLSLSVLWFYLYLFRMHKIQLEESWFVSCAFY